MRFRRSRKLSLKASLDTIPLINVVFLLILFFLMAPSFVVQSSINIRMAPAKGPVAYGYKDLSVTLAYGDGGPDGKGRIYVDDAEITDMGELSRRLAEAHASRPDLMLLISPDARIESARLIEILGIASSVGIERYGIAAQPPAKAGAVEDIPK